MDITVKVKFGSNKQSIESFGSNRYLVYINSKKEDESMAYAELVRMLSKKLGTPEGRIELRRDLGETKVFFIN